MAQFPDFQDAVRYDCVTVILACDMEPVKFDVFDRVVGAAMPVFQLFAFGPGGQSQDLMAEADAENRQAAFQ